VGKDKGTIKVEINYITHLMMVQYDPDLISNIEILKDLRNLDCKFLRIVGISN
jgi:hypothetical protein